MGLDQSERKKILSQKDIKNLRNQIREEEKDVQKWRTLFDLTLKHGLRNLEAVSRKWHHIDFEQKELVVDHAKGAKNRAVAISPSFLQRLEALGQGSEGKMYLFPSTYNQGHISKRTFQRHMRKWVVDAGLYQSEFGVDFEYVGGYQFEPKVKDIVPEKRRVTPHTLRHTFATQHLKQGTPIERVSSMLGHEDVKTTYEEYSHLVTEDHREFQNKIEL